MAPAGQPKGGVLATVQPMKVGLTILAFFVTFAAWNHSLTPTATPALFALSFLASTLIPLGSEWLSSP